MVPEIISLGEALVEIMRHEVGVGFDRPDFFVGPFPSGAPAIFADCAARLGARVGFIGTVGNDDFGKVILDRLEKDGVDLRYCYIDSHLTTGVAFVAYFEDGSRKFIYHIGNAASGVIEEERIKEDYFEGASFLHINGSALSMNEAWRKAIYRAVSVARERGVKISLDPNLRPEILGVDKVRDICRPVVEAASFVFPSGEEAMMLTGKVTPDEACRFLVESGVEYVVLKRGDKGSTVYVKGRSFEVPAFKVDEVDPTGAGDCFDAAFLVGMLRGFDLEKCARFANAVGALAVTRKGPMEGAPFFEDAMSFMERS